MNASHLSLYKIAARPARYTNRTACPVQPRPPTGGTAINSLPTRFSAKAELPAQTKRFPGKVYHSKFRYSGDCSVGFQIRYSQQLEICL
jgi:hypothetical protein